MRPGPVSVTDSMIARKGFDPFSKRITCKNKNRSHVACINKLCEKYAFICDDKSCTCQKDHNTRLKEFNLTFIERNCWKYHWKEIMVNSVLYIKQTNLLKINLKSD